jgi:hypothetical protein
MSQREAARHFNISRDSVAKMMPLQGENNQEAGKARGGSEPGLTQRVLAGSFSLLKQMSCGVFCHEDNWTSIEDSVIFFCPGLRALFRKRGTGTANIHRF